MKDARMEECDSGEKAKIAHTIVGFVLQGYQQMYQNCIFQKEQQQVVLNLDLCHQQSWVVVQPLDFLIHTAEQFSQRESSELLWRTTIVHLLLIT